MADEDLISGAEVPSDTPPVNPDPQSPIPTGGEDGGKPLTLREELVKNLNEFKEPKELRQPRLDGKSNQVVADGQLGPDGKKRDPETGQFVKAEDKAKKAVEAPKGAPVETAPKQDAQASAVSSPPSLPPGWSPETKAFVSSLPPDHPLRKDVEKREKEVSDGFKKYSDDAKRYSEIEQVLAPVRPAYQQAGIQSDAQAIKNLVIWESSFRNPQTRMQAFHNLARQFGVDLASFAQSPGSNQTPPDGAPQYQLQEAIQPYIAPLRSALETLQSDRAQNEIVAFSKDPSRPYFDRVRVQMGELIAQGRAQDLDGAYQMATMANPEIRQEIIDKAAEAKFADLQKQQKEQVQRSQSAKKAAISPSQRAPAGPALNGQKKPDGVRGSIMAAIDEIREGDRA